MSLPGIVTLLILAAIDSVQPASGISFDVKPLELKLVNNQFCEYGLRKRAPHKWCICWVRMEGTRIEAMPWDCLTRSPKFSRKKRRDKSSKWILEDDQNSGKMFPKDLLKSDVRVKPQEWHDRKQPNGAWLAKVFSTLFKEMTNSSGNKLLADARNLSLREEVKDDDNSRMPQQRKWHVQVRPEDRELVEKFLAAMSTKKNDSIDDRLTDEQLKHLVVPFLQSYIIDESLHTPIARLAQVLKSFLDDIENSTTIDDLEHNILLDIAVLGSKILTVKNSVVADLEELVGIFKDVSGNQSKAIGNSHVSNSGLRNRVSAEQNESPGVPKSKLVLRYPRNVTVLVDELGMKILFSALSKLGTLGGNSSSAARLEPADAVLVVDDSSSQSHNSSGTDPLDHLMDALRKSLRSNAGKLGFPGNNSDAAEFAGNPSKRSVEFGGSPVNGSGLDAFSGKPAVQIAENSSIPLRGSQPIAELLASLTQKRHVDGILPKNGTVDNPSATGTNTSHLPDPSENSNEPFPAPKNVSAAEHSKSGSKHLNA